MQSYHWSQTIKVKFECSLRYTQSIFHKNSFRISFKTFVMTTLLTSIISRETEKLINICRRASVHFKKAFIHLGDIFLLRKVLICDDSEEEEESGC